jgi:hypothetical protein
MIQDNRYLLLNYLKLDAREADEVAALLSLQRPTDEQLPRSVYRHEGGDRLLELVALPGLSAVGSLMGDSIWLEVERSVRPRLAVDFRRQVHVLRHAVRQTSALPRSASLQLTRMEVSPQLTQSYQALREQTLYPHVDKCEAVESFAALDAVVSTEPGSLYLTGFSCDKARFSETFATGKQRDFSSEAASRFVIGGAAAVHSSYWHKCDQVGRA